jgi:pimeloyl-ACP methyl ester carboxylesterase
LNVSKLKKMPSHSSIIRRKIEGTKRPLEIEVAIHPCDKGLVVVNYPGIMEDIYGANNRYGRSADLLQSKGMAVVRMGNPYYRQFPYPDAMIENLRYVVEHYLSGSKEVCGSFSPTMYLMGFSAGASAVAAVAADYSPIEKILLLAPAGDAGMRTIERGLQRFKGEVYILAGDKDTVVGPEAGQIFYDLAKNARKRELAIIPDCGHQFNGEANGRIMGVAPLWAFAGNGCVQNLAFASD